MLNEDRNLQIATITDTDTETLPGIVIVTVALRGLAIFDLPIPKEKYDPFMLMDLLARGWRGSAGDIGELGTKERR